MPRLLEFAIAHWDLFLALLIIIALMVAPAINRRLRGFKDVDPVDAVNLINRQDAVLVDVRENNEYAEGHVTDSLHLPLSGFAKQLQTLEAVKDRPVIVGCRSGARSARACGILRKNGFGQVYNLRGGMLAWENAGMPLTRGNEKKKKRKGKA